MKTTSEDIRQTFLDYFTEHGHLSIPGLSLVPENDPTLLVINSGMAPLKPYFTGEKTPPARRLCNIQKCVRTNDIDQVGDEHHLTFFEMMGNWSIGDYFKDEAINLAWKLISDVFGFDASKIYVTVFGGDDKLHGIPQDDESKEIWGRLVPSERIIPLGAECNFWGPTSDTGPCGPCTEIFIDRGVLGCKRPYCGPSCSCGRFVEIWNAGVFMEYYLHDDKSLTKLPMKSVDAGAGLDRFAFILQGVNSVYETDLLSPIVDTVIAGSNLDNESKSARIMSDHIRCATFMIGDGVYPANTRREYVLRRILRRAILHANLSGIPYNRLVSASMVAIKLSGGNYPELLNLESTIRTVVETEIKVFGKTLHRGLKELQKVIARSQQTISGEDAFRLHDTLGLPLELTRDVAEKNGLAVNSSDYHHLLEQQRERSRSKK